MVDTGASGKWACGVAAVALVASCVPVQHRAAPAATLDVGAPASTTLADADPAIASAASLLRRLELDIAPPDLPPFAGQESARFAGAALPSFLAAARSADDAARATECMTAAIYYEARSEPVDGQRAVAQVVLNRVRDRAFPGSVCGVVWQGSNRATGCQFSFTCDGSLDRPRDPYAWARARVVAISALSGEGYAPVGAATHYHTTAIMPWWAPSLRRIGLVGSHIFYRWAAPLERALSFRKTYLGIEPGAAPVATLPLEMTEGGMTGIGPGMAGGAPYAQQVAATPMLENGVAVHRDAAHPVRVASIGELPPQPSAASLHGVRVHRGAPPSPAPSSAPESATADQSDAAPVRATN